MGAEFGSCGHRWEGKRTNEMQNRLEVQFSRKDRMREGSYDGEVGRQGHPQNFVRPSIEGEHKFGGWISQRWVPSSAVAGIDDLPPHTQKKKEQRSSLREIETISG